MVVALVVVTVLVVVYVAFVAVGREAFTLGVQPRAAVFDLEEAVDYVADRLPEPVTAQISYDDVRALLRWHLEYLRDRGVPSRRERAASGGPVVVEDDEAVAYVLMRADAEGMEITDEQVASVLDTLTLYLEAIGAVGHEVADPLALEPGDAPPELPPPGGP